MDIIFHKDFDKILEKSPPKTRDKVRKVLDTYHDDPHNPQLDNHALHGHLQDFRSISAGGDLRLIFLQEDNDDHVKFYLVGSHSQLYE
jgi:addiction module RelE/StbE family toxin